MTKPKYIVVLMVVSQLLLVVFLGQWLVSQYHNEREVLHKDITQKFEEANREMTDSALFHKYIMPFAGNVHMTNLPGGKAKMYFSDDVETDSILKEGKKRARLEQRTIVRVEVHDTSTANIENEISAFIPGKMGVMKEMAQSLRIWMSKNEKDSGNIELNYDLRLEPDTLLLKKAFTKRMKDYDFSIQWQTHLKSKAVLNDFYFSAQNHDKFFGALVTGVNVFLLKRITPQILFGILLVALTGLAFIFAYRSIRSQQRLNTLRQEFISNMSHELKTPLSTVKVTIEALKTYNSEKRMEHAGEYLDIAYAELNRLDGLINDVLNTSIMESGQVEIDAVKTDLDAMVHAVIKTFHLHFREKNATVKYHSTGPVMAMADALHVQGVITNLIDNSLKYAKINDPEITIWFKQEGNKVTLNISDNGPGIPVEYIDKIFDKFFRVPTYDKHNTKGYGLGLNYAKLVMEKHGETISVKNNAIAGCIFTLTFKAA
jgi:signal transduction histidine kinase